MCLVVDLFSKMQYKSCKLEPSVDSDLAHNSHRGEDSNSGKLFRCEQSQEWSVFASVAISWIVISRNLCFFDQLELSLYSSGQPLVPVP